MFQQAQKEGKLKPFPKVTTVASTQGIELLNQLNEGALIRVSLPSDQARLWATLCNYRIDAKHRLEASMNAVLTNHLLVGNGADGISNELNGIARASSVDAVEPWRERERTDAIAKSALCQATHAMPDWGEVAPGAPFNLIDEVMGEVRLHRCSLSLRARGSHGLSR